MNDVQPYLDANRPRQDWLLQGRRGRPPEQQEGIRLCLVSDRLNAWHGVFLDVEFATRVLKELDREMPGAYWQLRALDYNRVHFKIYFGEWYGELDGKESLNHLRHWQAKRLAQCREQPEELGRTWARSSNTTTPKHEEWHSLWD